MEYTISQIKSMQQEATRRVQEMNRRAKTTAERAHPIPPPTPAPPSVPPAPKPNDTQKAPLSFLRSLDLKKLISGENSDQTLLLLLVLVLLSDQNSDDFLIYALIYIML